MSYTHFGNLKKRIADMKELDQELYIKIRGSIFYGAVRVNEENVSLIERRFRAERTTLGKLIWRNVSDV